MPSDNQAKQQIYHLERQVSAGEKRAINLRRNGDNTSKALFEASNARDELERKLDSTLAQMESMKHRIVRLKDKNETLERLNVDGEKQVAREKAENAKLRAKLQISEEKRNNASAEFDHLMMRYDEVVAHRDRGMLRYKKDYDKWRRFRAWFFLEKSGKHDGSRSRMPALPGPSNRGERPSDEKTRIAAREYLMHEEPYQGRLEFPELSDIEDGQAPEGLIPVEADKENKRETDSDEDVTMINDGSLSANIKAAPRMAMDPPLTPSRQKGGRPLQPLSPFSQPALRVAHVRPDVEKISAGSLFESSYPEPPQYDPASITEEESQMPLDIPLIIPNPRDVSQPQPVKAPRPSQSTMPAPTHAPSRPPAKSTPKAAKAAPSTNAVKEEPIDVDSFPDFPSTTKSQKNKDKEATALNGKAKRKREDKDRRRSDVHQLPSRSESMDDARPTKLRRVASEEDLSSRRGNAIASGSQRVQQSAPKNAVASGNGKLDDGKQGGKGEIDYSVFKGRGRYAAPKKKQSTDDLDLAINAEYEINPAKNGGLGFQYDAVVRGKQDRKRMDADDCECCREYYEAIGPLPPRLEKPLWRSPTSSQDLPIPPPPHCQHIYKTHGKGANQPLDVDMEMVFEEGISRQMQHDAAVAKHKQTVSRHRHNWERAKTPPGYWNIGFPSTQEADQINQEAKVMQKEKKQRVELEAKRDNGKYRKR